MPPAASPRGAEGMCRYRGAASTPAITSASDAAVFTAGELPGHYDIATDVVVRWKDYGDYGSREKAAAALKRRANVPTQEAERLLDVVAAAHAAAVEAVPTHVRRRPLKVNPFALAKDIDRAACLRVMQRAVPDLPRPVAEHVLGWVIYWHWMR